MRIHTLSLSFDCRIMEFSLQKVWQMAFSVSMVSGLVDASLRRGDLKENSNERSSTLNKLFNQIQKPAFLLWLNVTWIQNTTFHAKSRYRRVYKLIDWMDIQIWFTCLLTSVANASVQYLLWKWYDLNKRQNNTQHLDEFQTFLWFFAKNW